MKVCTIQPPYSENYKDSDSCFQFVLQCLNACDPSMDLIVLPEYCDVPALASTPEEFAQSVQKYNETILKAAKETAIRCHAAVCVNAVRFVTESTWRNTTHVINAAGETVGHYYKAHPAPSEEKRRGIDVSYTYEPQAPMILEMDGLRYAFLTCYDFYFYEAFPAIARQNPDIIIGASHQRSDSHEALELIDRFLSYHTNAYVVRASVSLGASSPTGGCSMVTAPDGAVLLNMKNNTGFACCDIDPRKKLFKPAGYRGEVKSHPAYIEDGRRPWNYRPAGPFVVPDDAHMPYPRVCAHRGFNTIAPENSMPAYGAAVAMGAEEIEFDLWWTKDRQIVSLHDSSLDRVSDGTGDVRNYTYEELLQFDFGKQISPALEGLRIPRFEDILKQFACRTIMNIHLKTPDQTSPYDEDLLAEILRLWKQYDIQKHAYLMTSNSTVIAQARKLMPDILICRGAGSYTWDLVDAAIADHADKVQLFRPYINREMIEKAHAHGIRCNIFWADEPELAEAYLDLGVDTILTNDYFRIAQVVQNRKKAISQT